MFELRCTRTGRWWHLETEQECVDAARDAGIADYDIAPVQQTKETR